MTTYQTHKPFSQACENNKHPILTHLSRVFSQTQCVLEIGSGTGQHASYFAPALPHLSWQTSDLPNNHMGINTWLEDENAVNAIAPITVDLSQPWQWQQAQFDGIYTANTLHIISWPLVENFFAQAGIHLHSGGSLCVYGPFKYQEKFTSDSNGQFDLWLKEQNKTSGIRDIERVIKQAAAHQLTLVEDNDMPANNRLLVFKKD